ncbi:hypothetical protein BaRGS_00012227 [Batillaria attramentaria]|uniref:Hexosyltransferase n=1 Tax=Batillaria attramentaria TaxID=370345 RepID=A0ABD0LB77_9CAEN
MCSSCTSAMAAVTFCLRHAINHYDGGSSSVDTALSVMELHPLAKVGPCLLAFFCLVLMPPAYYWFTSGIQTPEIVLVDLQGVEVPAVYKRAVRNPDGSVELTINIPAAADVIQRLMSHQEMLRQNLTLIQKNATSVGAEGQMSRTYYPVTVEAPYVINSPDVCRDVDPLHVLVVVHTATGNFQRRRLIRETWANRHVLTSRNLRVVFVLGLTVKNDTQIMIENEQIVYGDIVQGSFHDTYHNLTHKGVLAYRWIQQYCQHAQLIVKVDDDVFVNPFILYERYFPIYSRATRTIVCHVRPRNTSPIQRGEKKKWHVEEWQFRGYKNYPFEYCNGYMVLITPDIIRPMYRAAFATPFFWVDDVYLYGMLPARVGNVHHVDIKHNMTLHAKSGLKCYRSLNCSLLASGAYDENTMVALWQTAIWQVSLTMKTQLNNAYLIT